MTQEPTEVLAEPVTEAGKALLAYYSIDPSIPHTKQELADEAKLHTSILAIEAEALSQTGSEGLLVELRAAIQDEARNHRIHSEPYQTLRWLDDLIAAKQAALAASGTTAEADLMAAQSTIDHAANLVSGGRMTQEPTEVLAEPVTAEEALAEAWINSRPIEHHGQLCPVWTQRKRDTHDPCDCFVWTAAPAIAKNVLAHLPQGWSLSQNTPDGEDKP